MPESWTRVYPGVEFLGSCQLDDFVVVGLPVDGGDEAEPVTQIGAGVLLRSHTVIYAGVKIGEDFSTGHHVTIREFTEIGAQVSIGTGSVVEHRVRIDDEVRLHSNVFVPEFTELHRGCWLGPNVVITNAKYPLAPSVKKNLRGATIQCGAIIGANATLLPGVVIGESSVVGAGSVVVKDVPPGAVVAGNPARVINSKDRLPYGKKCEA